jgi:hypothetical protein
VASPPPFNSMWNKYPNGDSGTVKKMIGGKVDNPDYVNTCAIRMSYTLNNTGQNVKSGAGMLTVKGGDKKNYGLRMAEMAAYLKKQWGRPTLHVKNPGGSSSAFAGRQGVIAFLGIPGYSGGGHVDLWDGQKTAHGDYFNSSEVMLWEQKQSGQLAYKVTVKEVNVLSAKSTSSNVLAVLPRGSIFPVLKKEGSWLLVATTPMTAYVDGSKGVVRT